VTHGQVESVHGEYLIGFSVQFDMQEKGIPNLEDGTEASPLTHSADSCPSLTLVVGMFGEPVDSAEKMSESSSRLGWKRRQSFN